MHIKVTKINDWDEVAVAAGYTVDKTITNYTDKWKEKMVRSEHSPLRQLRFKVELTGIPYFVSVHLVRHNIGVDHYVSTQRSDRTGTPRDKKPQDAPVNHCMYLNAQALINMSKVRLCGKADMATRVLWEGVKKEVENKEPILAYYMVPSCDYRGTCPEFKPCWR